MTISPRQIWTPEMYVVWATELVAFGICLHRSIKHSAPGTNRAICLLFFLMALLGMTVQIMLEYQAD